MSLEQNFHYCDPATHKVVVISWHWILLQYSVFLLLLFFVVVCDQLILVASPPTKQLPFGTGACCDAWLFASVSEIFPVCDFGKETSISWWTLGSPS